MDFKKPKIIKTFIVKKITQIKHTITILVFAIQNTNARN